MSITDWFLKSAIDKETTYMDQNTCYIMIICGWEAINLKTGKCMLIRIVLETVYNPLSFLPYQGRIHIISFSLLIINQNQ
jgi:hypothetical protein